MKRFVGNVNWRGVGAFAAFLAMSGLSYASDSIGDVRAWSLMAGVALTVLLAQGR